MIEMLRDGILEEQHHPRNRAFEINMTGWDDEEVAEVIDVPSVSTFVQLHVPATNDVTSGLNNPFIDM